VARRLPSARHPDFPLQTVEKEPEASHGTARSIQWKPAQVDARRGAAPHHRAMTFPGMHATMPATTIFDRDRHA
jgi:hypothetical protein